MNEIAGPATRGGSITPPPDIDRSALSEAWYRALYGSEPKNARPFATNEAARTTRAAGSPAAREPVTSRHAVGLSTRGVAVHGMRTRPTFGVATLHRLRGEKLAAVTPAVRAWRSALARRTSCRLTLPEGVRIDLLLQQRGRRLHVVAIARGVQPSGQRVAAALLRAQVALIAHGVRLDSSVAPKGSA